MAALRPVRPTDGIESGKKLLPDEDEGGWDIALARERLMNGIGRLKPLNVG
ncbi:MAG: hypothetical protein WBD36_14375 [Bacteroidota bacterium]